VSTPGIATDTFLQPLFLGNIVHPPSFPDFLIECNFYMFQELSFAFCLDLCLLVLVLLSVFQCSAVMDAMHELALHQQSMVPNHPIFLRYQAAALALQLGALAVSVRMIEPQMTTTPPHDRTAKATPPNDQTANDDASV
jgi:hypothetical protein